MYALHVNIPAPAPKERKTLVGKPAKYPYSQMEYGDAFFAPLTDFKKPEKAEEAVRARASGWLRDNKHVTDISFRVAAAPHPETGEPSIGCWAMKKEADEAL